MYVKESAGPSQVVSKDKAPVFEIRAHFAGNRLEGYAVWSNGAVCAQVSDLMKTEDLCKEFLQAQTKVFEF